MLISEYIKKRNKVSSTKNYYLAIDFISLSQRVQSDNKPKTLKKIIYLRIRYAFDMAQDCKSQVQLRAYAQK